MRQKTLLFVALIVALVGVIILFFITPDISPQSLVVKGEITKIDEGDKVTFIEFVPEDFTVLSFNKVNTELGSAKLVGKLSSYEGKVEFIVEEVR